MCCCYLLMYSSVLSFFFFFFNDTATTEIYTLSLHDALPISRMQNLATRTALRLHQSANPAGQVVRSESTRLNSSHLVISYAVFCLKKKKKTTILFTAPTVNNNIIHYISHSAYF